MHAFLCEDAHRISREETVIYRIQSQCKDTLVTIKLRAEGLQGAATINDYKANIQLCVAGSGDVAIEATQSANMNDTILYQQSLPVKIFVATPNPIKS